MSGCCESCSLAKDHARADCGTKPSERTRLTVALAGNPNSGKTTVFNALTGLRQKVGNYPGVTVEKKVGLLRLPEGTWANVIDLPGTYSLVSRAPDERVARDVLRGLRADTPAPDVVVAVVDASNLQRNLYLVSQLIEMRAPLVIALNMMDVAERRGSRIDPEVLSRSLGVPVVPVVAHRRLGIHDLVHAIGRARPAELPDWQLPAVMRAEIAGLARALDPAQRNGAPLASFPARAEGEPPERRQERYRAMAERLLVGDGVEDLGLLHSPAAVATLVDSACATLRTAGVDPVQADIEAHYRWIEGISAAHESAHAVANEPAHAAANELARQAGPHERIHAPAHGSVHAPVRRRVHARPRSWSGSPVGERAPLPSVPLTERIDAILIHRVWGLLFFALIMGAMFASMFWLAKPLQEGLTAIIEGAGAAVSGLVPGEALQSLVRDGLFAGVGSVVVFIPQIAILFLFLALLEDSGYLARAAFLMDRLLAKVGLHGKSFIPLLSGFACAIPGIMATRTIEHRKGRLATILVLPFMTCSARLPVYGLLIGTFFASLGALRQAGIMLALYLLGILFAAGAAFFLRRTMLRGMDSGFLLELPTYKVPQLSVVGRQVLGNSSKFLTRAGTTILAICIVLWVISYFPRLPESRAAAQPDANAAAAAQREYSVAGRLGQAIEPGIRPLGFDWKIGVGVIGAFAAREVFVSTMAIVYGTGGDEETVNLATAMLADRHPDGSRIWTPLVAASLLLWFVLAMQCMSTVMVVRQETGGWRWPLFMLGYMNALAYVVCLLFYQIGSRL